jgi:hypothetical protein
MAEIYHSPGTGPKVDWQARYEAMRSVARRYRDGWNRDLVKNEWWRQLPLQWGIQAEPMTPDERRALDELEADRG